MARNPIDSEPVRRAQGCDSGRNRWLDEYLVEHHLAKPNWQPKQRDGNRGRGRDYPDSPRDNVIFHPSSNRRPDRPRQDNAKPAVAKQGVKGALRAANLRLLLENAPVPEAMALVAEVPLERLEAMSQGALCPDETAFHIERTLKLPGKWLDGLNKEVPARTLHLLKNPDQAQLLDDEELDEDSTTVMPVVSTASGQPTSEGSVVSQAAPAPAKTAAHALQVQEAAGDATAAVNFALRAASNEGSEEAPTGGPAVEADKALAAPESAQAAGKRAAAAPRRTAAAAEVQLHLSELASPLQPGAKDLLPMATPEVRKQNLAVLLQGKGAKSALARLLHAKPPYVSAMLSGRKALDQELCREMARVLGLPANWFEAPRTAADIPASTLERLAPLRGAATDANTAPSSDTAEVPLAVTDSSGPSAGQTDAAEDDGASHAAPIKQTRRRAQGAQQPIEPTDLVEASTSAGTTAAPQAELLVPVAPEAQPAAQAPAPALRTEVIAPAALAPVAAPAEAPAPVDTYQATLRAADFTPVYSQPLVIEGGLAPITEALIKILVLKARQGALSEDKAFELLGELRLL
jgi:hypothetical protein